MNPLVLNLLVWLLELIALAVLAYLAYFFLSLPLRRRERARLFLDLIELGLRDGRGVEQTVCALGATGDRALGSRFHRFATHLAAGLPLAHALARVPSLLPPPVAGMLRAGHAGGDLPGVLAACRQRLQDHVDAVAAAHHYFMLFALVVSPAWIATFAALFVFVMPKFLAIAEDMGTTTPSLLIALASHSKTLVVAQTALLLGLYGLVLAYVGGPRLAGWISRIWPGLPDRLAWLFPWKRLRLQRDFSSVLAILLDAGLPEARALDLAGESTANAVMRGRAGAAVADLERGAGLPSALRRLDVSGQFRWRLENAMQGPARFRAALDGWHEVLSARAWQLEQTAAQLATTGLVLVNGLFVGALALGVFGMLLSVIEGGLLW